MLASGETEVDPKPYLDTFDCPAAPAPIQARALLAAIELLGVDLSEYFSTAQVAQARARRRRQRGPAGPQRSNATRIARQVGEAIEASRLIELEHNGRTRTLSTRRRAVRADRFAPGLVRPRVDPLKEEMCLFRLDCIKCSRCWSRVRAALELDLVADVEGWERKGEVEGSRIAHVWISLSRRAGSRRSARCWPS